MCSALGIFQFRASSVRPPDDARLFSCDCAIKFLWPFSLQHSVRSISIGERTVFAVSGDALTRKHGEFLFNFERMRTTQSNHFYGLLFARVPYWPFRARARAHATKPNRNSRKQHMASIDSNSSWTKTATEKIKTVSHAK